jgi:hypothetical protein
MLRRILLFVCAAAVVAAGALAGWAVALVTLGALLVAAGLAWRAGADTPRGWARALSGEHGSEQRWSRRRRGS